MENASVYVLLLHHGLILLGQHLHPYPRHEVGQGFAAPACLAGWLIVPVRHTCSSAAGLPSERGNRSDRACDQCSVDVGWEREPSPHPRPQGHKDYNP